MLHGTLSNAGELSGVAQVSETLTGTMTGRGTLHGEIATESTLTGELSEKIHLNGEIRLPDEVYIYDYNRLVNKPRLNGVELVNDKDFPEFDMRSMTIEELNSILRR